MGCEIKKIPEKVRETSSIKTTRQDQTNYSDRIRDGTGVGHGSKAGRPGATTIPVGTPRSPSPGGSSSSWWWELSSPRRSLHFASSFRAPSGQGGGRARRGSSHGEGRRPMGRRARDPEKRNAIAGPSGQPIADRERRLKLTSRVGTKTLAKSARGGGTVRGRGR